MMRENRKDGVEVSQLLRSLVPNGYWDVGIERVHGSVRPQIENYLANIISYVTRGTGLLLYGMNGNGKTSTAVLIAKEVLRYSGSVLFTTSAGLCQAQLKDLMFESGVSMVHRAEIVDLLILDDLGKEYRGDSGWSLKFLENLLRVRSSYNKATIITTNIPLADFVKVYSISMVSVITASLVSINVEGCSLRRAVELDL